MAEGSSEASSEASRLTDDAPAESGNLHATKASSYQYNDGSFFPVETVKFRVVWKKTIFDITFGLDEKAIKLKEHIQTLTGHSLCPSLYRIIACLFTME